MREEGERGGGQGKSEIRALLYPPPPLPPSSLSLGPFCTPYFFSYMPVADGGAIFNEGEGENQRKETKQKTGPTF